MFAEQWNINYLAEKWVFVETDLFSILTLLRPTAQESFVTGKSLIYSIPTVVLGNSIIKEKAPWLLIPMIIYL